MKKKSFEKKLLFNKSTVACLDAAQLDNARGGSDIPTKISDTCPILTVCGESVRLC
jgi:hypothetical protein